MQTEYLITFEIDKNLCISPDSFKRLLSTHKDIKVENKSICYKNKKFNYKLASGLLSDNSIYYDLSIEIDDNFNDEEIYSELLKEIRVICNKLSGRNIIELQSAISEFYCKKGYEKIFTLETIMRKLIYKFMAISIGYKWKDESTPREVAESIRNKNEDVNFLHEIDFIKLSDFLFKDIYKKDYQSLIKEIKSKDNSEHIDVKELKEFLPYTNWERFFAERVDCESTYLKSRWDKLYEHRCSIAHNKTFSKQQYIELENIYNEVFEKLNSALDSINDIHVEQDEREEIAENISVAKNDITSEFIKLYNLITKYVREICEMCSSSDDKYNSAATNKTNFLMQIRYLCHNKGIIERELLHELEDLAHFRNLLIHQFGNMEISEQDLSYRLLRLKEIIRDFLHIYNYPKDLFSLKGTDLRS